MFLYAALKRNLSDLFVLLSSLCYFIFTKQGHVHVVLDPLCYTQSGILDQHFKFSLFEFSFASFDGILRY